MAAKVSCSRTQRSAGRGGSVVECSIRDQGLRVKASPEALRCVLEKNT